MDDLAVTALPMSVHAATDHQQQYNHHSNNSHTHSNGGRRGGGGGGGRHGNRSGGRNGGGRGGPSGRGGHGGRGATTSSSSPRLQRPKVHHMPRMLADTLEEPKIALMHRVVNLAGADTAWKALVDTMAVEKQGGLTANADACGRPPHMMVQANALLGQQQPPQPRRRSKGGIFLSMVKSLVTPEVYKQIFQVEEEIKKKRKKQMRQIRYQKMDAKINGLPLQELHISTGRREDGQEEEQEEGEVDANDVAMMEEA